MIDTKELIALKETLQSAVSNLFEHQLNIFAFTSETGQTEWNLTHHLAVELHPFFSKLDCDVDVTKRSYGDRRPDIIFHKRGSHESNYLVVEVKKDGDPHEVEADIAKIDDFWFKDPLRYRFGAVIDLRSDGHHRIEVFENPA